MCRFWLGGTRLVAALALPASAHSAVWSMRTGVQEPENPKVRVCRVLSVDPGVYERGIFGRAVNIRWQLTHPSTRLRRDIVSRDKFKAMLENAADQRHHDRDLRRQQTNWLPLGAPGYSRSTASATRPKSLNGGRKVWEAKSLPLDNKTPSYTKTAFDLPAPKLALRGRLADVSDVVQGKKKAVIIDIRGPDEYSGKIFAPAGVQELAIRAGHVPGAKNIPWGQAVAADGTFKSKEELQKLYRGRATAAAVIVYCPIGERSSQTWFVRAKISATT